VKALPLITRPEDRQTLLQAQALHGLFLDHLDRVAQLRVAELLATAARHLRRPLRHSSSAWSRRWVWAPALAR